MKRWKTETLAGFTLIEMIMVVAVIGIVVGMSAMALSNISGASLSTSTREVADFMNLCRSQAISKHTVVRFGVVTSVNSDEFPEVPFRAYSSWAWNKKRKQFEQKAAWKSLPGDVVFAIGAGQMIRGSKYASDDASSVRGDFFVHSSNYFTELKTPYGEAVVNFFEFTPSGRARLPDGEKRNIISVLKPGNNSGKGTPNWSQINVDTLTGRVRVYRPE